MAASTNNSRLLPPNATKGEKSIVEAISVNPLPVEITSVWNPQTCPASLLPWLAWALSLDDWKSYWTESVKRSRIASAIAIQRKKGTVASVRTVVESFGGALSLREWWELSPVGVPHTFEVVLTISGQGGQQVTAEFVDDVIQEISRTKPVRSHFTFTQGLQATGGSAVVPAGRVAVYRRIQLTGV